MAYCLYKRPDIGKILIVSEDRRSFVPNNIVHFLLRFALRLRMADQSQNKRFEASRSRIRTAFNRHAC